MEIARAREHLATGLDREPSVGDLAAYLKLSEEEINEGVVAANGYTAGPLEIPNDGDGPSSRPRSYADVLGETDPAIEIMENLHALAPLLEQLDARDRRIIEMRFGGEMTQAQIGAELGLSQMHISRLLNRALTQLRSGMLA